MISETKIMNRLLRKLGKSREHLRQLHILKSSPEHALGLVVLLELEKRGLVTVNEYSHQVSASLTDKGKEWKA